jgi:hypothetical protein
MAHMRLILAAVIAADPTIQIVSMGGHSKSFTDHVPKPFNTERLLVEKEPNPIQRKILDPEPNKFMGKPRNNYRNHR